MTTNQLSRIDSSSLNRALLGFDSLFDNFERRFANQLNNNYPPYNIIKQNENLYELEIAVTGFAPEEITVEIDQSQLVVKGERKRDEDADAQYLHRGLAARDFTRTWTLADHMQVERGSIKNGVLKITIKRVIPESLKPRILDIVSE